MTLNTNTLNFTIVETVNMLEGGSVKERSFHDYVMSALQFPLCHSNYGQRDCLIAIRSTILSS